MTFHVYTPIVGTNPFLQKKGLGMPYGPVTDVQLVGASWWYDWGVTLPITPGYVPMLWGGNIDLSLPQSYDGFLLFLNEPELASQANRSPGEAFKLYKLVKEWYPLARLVVGGLNSMVEYRQNFQWLKTFLTSFYENNEPLPDRWHIHGYVERELTASRVINLWKQFLGLVPGSIWITEYGDPLGDTDNFQDLTEFAMNEPRIERFAPFANRLTGAESWYPSAWAHPPAMQLINKDGSLTNTGKIYEMEGRLI